MKKFLSLLLTLTMMLSLCTVAFAAGGEATVTGVTEDNTASFDVTGTVTVNEDAYADIAYSVKVEWTVADLALNINKDQSYTWNPATLSYEVGTATADPTGFDAQDVAVSITLTNSSNAAVNYAIAYADNSTDTLTTSEAAKEGSSKTGTLANADTCGAATALTEGDYDYAIAADKLAQGSAKTASYTGTVTLSAINDTKDMTSGTLTLGTYTVTLSKYEEPAEPETKTVNAILSTVDGGFPTSGDFKAPDNAWKDEGGTTYAFINQAGKLVTDTKYIDINETATKNGNDYTVQTVCESKTIILTFVMTDNVLTAIKYECADLSKNLTFSAPTT